MTSKTYQGKKRKEKRDPGSEGSSEEPKDLTNHAITKTIKKQNTLEPNGVGVLVFERLIHKCKCVVSNWINPTNTYNPLRFGTSEPVCLVNYGQVSIKTKEYGS